MISKREKLQGTTLHPISVELDVGDKNMKLPHTEHVAPTAILHVLQEVIKLAISDCMMTLVQKPEELRTGSAPHLFRAHIVKNTSVVKIKPPISTIMPYAIHETSLIQKVCRKPIHLTNKQIYQNN